MNIHIVQIKAIHSIEMPPCATHRCSKMLTFSCLLFCTRLTIIPIKMADDDEEEEEKRKVLGGVKDYGSQQNPPQQPHLNYVLINFTVLDDIFDCVTLGVCVCVSYVTDKEVVRRTDKVVNKETMEINGEGVNI